MNCLKSNPQLKKSKDDVTFTCLQVKNNWAFSKETYDYNCSLNQVISNNEL